MCICPCLEPSHLILTTKLWHQGVGGIFIQSWHTLKIVTPSTVTVFTKAIASNNNLETGALSFIWGGPDYYNMILIRSRSQWLNSILINGFAISFSTCSSTQTIHRVRFSRVEKWLSKTQLCLCSQRCSGLSPVDSGGIGIREANGYVEG